MRCTRRWLALGLLLASAGAMAQASDDDIEPIPVEMLGLGDEGLAEIYARLYARASGPGATLGSPAAFGSANGNAGVGFGGQTRPRSDPHNVDGAFGVVAGIGDPTRWVAMELSLAVISIYDDIGHDGAASLKLHHRVSPLTSVAVGAINLAPWGEARNVDPSWFGVVSHIHRLKTNVRNPPQSIAVSLGLGNRGFTDDGRADPNPFGAVQYSWNPCCAVIADWSGTALSAGISVAPVAHWPVSVTVGASDLTDRRDEGTQFVAGVGYSFRLF